MPRRKQVFALPPEPTREHELACRKKGFSRVAGIDEAGRGPLAGPVVAAAVVLPQRFECAGLDDSKKLTATRRERLFGEITGHRGVQWGTGVADVAEIDSVNILKASWLAMERAVSALAVAPDFALVDGLPIPGFSLPHDGLVKGDARSLSIAAASVLAKVQRDRAMVALAHRYPGYGFEKHKGYGTQAHLRALEELGPCPEHRRSFAPVARLVGTDG